MATAAEPEVRLPKKHLTLLQDYCFDCHDADTQKGKVNLEALPLQITEPQQAELWQKVLNAMNSGEMPPEDKRQPKSAEKADFLDALAQTMVAARNKLSDTGGKITMRRLNRREYRNTIKHLTGVTPDVSSLPSDAGSGTFDTVGSSQFISSDQFEQYLNIGRAAIDEVFERQAAQGQPSRVFRVEPEKTVNVKNAEIFKSLEDNYRKKWLTWKEGVDKAAKAVENREIVAALRKEHPDYDSHPTLKYRKADLLKGAPDPRDYGGSDPINAVAALYSPYQRYHRYMKHYAGLPHNDRGAYLRLSRGIQRFDVRPDPKDVPPGTYKLRIRVGAVKGSDPSRHFIEIGHPQKLNGTSPGFAKLLSTQPVSGTIENPEIIEVTVEIGASTPREVGIQERQPKSAKLLRQDFDRHKKENSYGPPPAIWVDWMELEGPIQNKTPESKIVRVEPEQTINPANEKEIAELEDSYARFTRWQKGVDEAAKTPANQAKIAEIRKTDPRIGSPFLFYAFADQLEGVPDAKDFGFRDSNKAASAHPKRDRGNLAYHKRYAALPHRDRGAYLKLAYGTGWVLVAPKELPPGNYVMRVRVGVVKDTPAARRFIQVGHPQRLIPRNRGLAGRAISTHQVAGSIENPETIEIPLTVGSDTPKEFAIQEKQPNTGNLKELWGAHNVWKKKNGYGHPPAIWIDWVELEGPLPKVEIAKSKTYRVEPENTINPKNERAIKELEDTFERFARWKKGVDEAAKTPENQALIAEIGKKEPQILHPLRFYRFAGRLKGMPDARDFGFEEAHAPTTANPEWPNLHAYLKHYASLPHRDTGAYLKPTKGTGRVIVSPEKLPLGNYTLRVRVGAVEGSDPSRHFIQVGHPQRQYTAAKWDHGLEGRAISTHQVSGTVEKPEIIEIPLQVGSDTLREFAVQEKQPNNGKMKALWQTFNEFKKKNGYGIPPAIWIDWVELEGPISGDEVTWKNHREVEDQANHRINWLYNGYYKRGHDAGKAFLKTGEPQPKAGVNDEREAKFRIRRLEREGPTFERYLNNPLTKTGTLLSIFHPHRQEFVPFPPEQVRQWRKIDHEVEQLPPGDYKVRFRIGAVAGTPTERHFVDLGMVPAEGVFHHLSTYQVTGTTKQPQVIEASVRLAANGPRLLSIREKRDPQNDVRRYNDSLDQTGFAPEPALWIDWVEWEGPFEESQPETGLASILAKHSGDGSETVRNILADFSVHAFRGVQPDPKFIDQLLAIYQTRRKAGDTHDVAVRLPLSVILASPGFLYLNEPGNEKVRRALTARELAVRLAYFLWSGPPDQQLLALAAKDQLHKPQILRQQVDRLIADPRSDEFVSGFVHQWLDMERLDFFQFDTTLHREFDESTRAASRREVYESFAHLLRSTTGGAIGKLLKSDYVFINGLLATYYGIDGISGDQFQKVTLPAGSPRGGLLGMAAIHAMGSDGVASSPVERGAWVLRHLLHDPPPPAPPNVPQLSRLAGKPLSTREKLAAHQEEPQCASCHRKIDPIGFGLENFNAAGKWRAEEFQYTKTRRGYALSKTGTPIDTSGQFHNGPSFADYEELRNLIAQREPDFARGFTEHLVEYALGRPYGFTDQTLANEILTASKDKQYAVSEFIHALVQSSPFRFK